MEAIRIYDSRGKSITNDIDWQLQCIHPIPSKSRIDSVADEVGPPARQIDNLGQRIRQNGELRVGVWRHGRLS